MQFATFFSRLGLCCVRFSILSGLYFYFYFFYFFFDDTHYRLRRTTCLYIKRTDIAIQVFTFLIFLTRVLQDYSIKFHALNLKRTQPMAIALYSRTENK